MKAHEALIAWTPANLHTPTSGQVKVGPLLNEGEYDWTWPYSFSGGAALTRVRKLRGGESIAQLFIDFHTLVVRDGIAPEEAHKEFLAIDEYAERISADIKGSRNPDLW